MPKKKGKKAEEAVEPPHKQIWEQVGSLHALPPPPPLTFGDLFGIS